MDHVWVSGIKRSEFRRSARRLWKRGSTGFTGSTEVPQEKEDPERKTKHTKANRPRQKPARKAKTGDCRGRDRVESAGGPAGEAPHAAPGEGQVQTREKDCQASACRRGRAGEDTEGQGLQAHGRQEFLYLILLLPCSIYFSFKYVTRSISSLPETRLPPALASLSNEYDTTP